MELVKELRDEAARLIGYGVDRGSQEATISGNLANRAADTIEETLEALKEAAEFIQPFNRAQELLSRIEGVISKASA